MFEKQFCTSPWFSMRIKANGNFAYCGWAEDHSEHNIKNVDIKEYFQNTLSSYRKKLLDGESLSGCHACYDMEKHNKVSGRQKQLLKTGIQHNNLKTIHTSSIIEKLKHSQNNNGHTAMMPVDWKIDLGNYCNSACVMCLPDWSSRMATELYEIGITAGKPQRWVWSEDEACLGKFIDTLDKTENLKYLHFLGGETTIMPAFRKILKHLVQTGNCKNLIIGFTTNLTTWNKELIALLKQFKEVHVGMSVESLTPLNDYIRWPSTINDVKNTMEKWIECSTKHNWLVSLRTTPTLLSISGIDQVFEFAFEKNISVESCHFLYRPECLQIQGLPQYLRSPIIEKLENFIRKNKQDEELILNVRNKLFARQAVIQDAESLLSFLREEPYVTTNHKNLVAYIEKLEKHRGNRILDYIPHYEKFFTSIGYNC
jgi:MoaA/NifB/PqqE/SkfB family radical SAM enzyme